ncbi:WXG100 family type VII secretion target [Aristaeella hokkaidonensis]|uniref:WXG100 family type VII secretion target n=1 Tax=Aristaeella hokkaidonensis TaxID=3046382 RepID=A0AC61N5V1_9FIRM|nr:WXG100 family type VII secretion target [Aristaeella hokkaidonensis]QUC66378.1 WXG100 family type VII secretion target [Aristaeella hokkaidonensis]SNT94211.1 Proteins of 100 residues with WXG [Aristaeella hokkaidonensis]
MASGEIIGNTSRIKSTASGIKDDAASYGSASRILFETVDNLGKSFTSEDGQAYISKIESYRESFETMQKKLDASAEALETAAVSYENTIKANMV